MADINKRGASDCEDGEGERGKRGKRGHQGHDGRDGSTDALTALTAGVVYRPNDPAGSRGNVYVTWAEVYAALQSVAGLGPVTLQFDNSFATFCDIPAGSWDMTNVSWDSVVRAFNQATVRVNFLSGASITVAATTNLRIVGHHMAFICRRAAMTDPAPFSNVNLYIDGTDCFFVCPGSFPIYETFGGAGERFIVFTGKATTSRFRGETTNPTIDIQDGGALFIQGGNGQIVKNSVLSSIPGASSLHLNIVSDSFSGGNEEFNDFQFPLFTAAGGVVSCSGFYRNRYQNFNGGPTYTITDADNPYQMRYNEFIKADSTLAAVDVTAPGAATVVSGERITIKDATGGAALFPITLSPLGADTVQGGVISNAFGSKTWASDGAGGWWVIASS